MKSKSIFVSILLLCILCILSVIFAFTLLENFANQTLLKVIAAAQPGKHISSVKEKVDGLDGPIILSEQNMFLGSINDLVFCKNKHLYTYYVTPKCRLATIYTDTNGIIVFVSWKRL